MGFKKGSNNARAAESEGDGGQGAEQRIVSNAGENFSVLLGNPEEIGFIEVYYHIAHTDDNTEESGGVISISAAGDDIGFRNSRVNLNSGSSLPAGIGMSANISNGQISWNISNSTDDVQLRLTYKILTTISRVHNG